MTNLSISALIFWDRDLVVATWDGVFRSGYYSGFAQVPVYAFAVSGTNLFAGTAEGLFRNSSGWIPLNNGLSSGAIMALAVSGAHLFAGIQNGVFLSRDDGASWAAAGCSDADGVIAFAISDSNLFAGTGTGVWRRPLSELTSVGNPTADVPKTFALQQNYPNPFNPSTTIIFELPKTAHVNLKVFDILGREVVLLVNERKAPGKYEVKFDGSNLASGVYFYRIQAGDFVQTRKLVLLK